MDQKCNGVWLSGKPGEGEYKLWYPDDTLALRCYYRNNQLHGRYWEWHESPKSAGRSNLGKGIRKQVFRECNYLHGKLHGRYAMYYKDGSPDIICTYRNGLLHGLYRAWSKDRRLEKKVIYVNGIPLTKRKGAIL